MENYYQYPTPESAAQEWAASSTYKHEIKAVKGGCLTLLSVDLPTDVTLDILKNGLIWFKSDGNEKGTLRFCGIPFDLLNITIKNNNASAAIGHVRLLVFR